MKLENWKHEVEDEICLKIDTPKGKWNLKTRKLYEI